MVFCFKDLIIIVYNKEDHEEVDNFNIPISLKICLPTIHWEGEKFGYQVINLLTNKK